MLHPKKLPFILRATTLWPTLLLIAIAPVAPAQAQQSCIGDCDQSGSVTIDELTTGVRMALGTAPLLQCPAFECAGGGRVTVACLTSAVINALEGCSGSRLDPIRTTLDPAWDYAFEGAKFVPPPGKTLLILGQTLGGINEHVESFPDEPVPGGWAAYWGIPSMDGVNSTFLNDTGSRQNHQILVERFPNTVLQSGLWMVGKWNVAQNTADGAYDAVVHAFGAWAKATRRPIYLRIGYEFDGPHNELDPETYIAAYRRIVDLLRADGVDNIAFVWHSYASPPYRGHPISAWYPGDSYVDWVGISLFGHMYGSGVSRDLDAVFRFAREARKPVMVAEASPIHGISSSSDWEPWFVNFFSLAYERNIKAISFINENWERFNFPGTSWRDARLQNDSEVAEAFFEETNKDRYLKQSPDLFDQLGYTAPESP